MPSGSRQSIWWNTSWTRDRRCPWNYEAIISRQCRRVVTSWRSSVVSLVVVRTPSWNQTPRSRQGLSSSIAIRLHTPFVSSSTALLLKTDSRLLKDMKRIASILVVAVLCRCTMTSLAMTSNAFSKILSSTGAQVCSSDSNTSPYHVFPLFAGGEIRCGIECLVSSLCWYYQFKASSEPEQCELYNKMPVIFSAINDCVGFKRIFMG